MQKQDAWARFWRGGSLTSFGDKFAKGYEGDLRALWTAFFTELPDAAIVVDFGAGNGALEEVAQKYCAEQRRKFTMHAIDLAPSLPAHFKVNDNQDLCAIQWHSATANEATGLKDDSVDAVIGNYAFEYGDDEKTIAEIARILKPDGRCQFLMHHIDSNIIRSSKVELDVLDAELEKGGFVDAVRDYLREFGDVRKPGQFEKMKQSGKAEPYRKKMNETHLRAVHRAKTENSTLLIQQIMQWTSQLVAPPMFYEPKQILLDRLREIREELQANRSRLRDMQNAAVDEQRVQNILKHFNEHGLPASAEAFYVSDEPAVVGWRVSAKRF